MVDVGFTGFGDENFQGFFPGFRYMLKFVALHHNVLDDYTSSICKQYQDKIMCLVLCKGAQLYQILLMAKVMLFEPSQLCVSTVYHDEEFTD